MKKTLLSILILIIVLALTPMSSALAHGEPVIVVQPVIVAAGEEITVIGTEMEAGELFVISLEGITNSIPLGEAAVVEEGDEGGFEAVFIIPADTPPGSYTVRAVTDEGETAVTDLTVTAPTNKASDGPATVQEPSGEPHDLDRSESTGQVIGIVIAALASLGLGFWLVRQ